MKAEIKQIKEELVGVISKLESPEILEFLKKVSVRDGEFSETGKMLTESFIPRANWYVKKLTAIIDKLPADKRGRKKMIDVSLPKRTNDRTFDDGLAANGVITEDLGDITLTPELDARIIEATRQADLDVAKRKKKNGKSI